LKGNQTIVEVPDPSKPDYRVEKAAFGKRAGSTFNKDKKATQGPDVKDLHAKIGPLSMENDFLSVALGRIDGASAKR